MTSATTLDLSRLGVPSLLAVDYESLRSAMLAKFADLWEEKRQIDPTLPAWNVGGLETDPAVVVTEEFAYFDVVLRGLVNDLAKCLRLVSATGADLDHIARTYLATPRLVLVEATATTEEVLESDDAYRVRAQVSSEALPEFGIVPNGYVYRILTLYGDRVLDVAPVRTGGGGLDLVILGREGDGTPAPTLIGDIAAAFVGDRNSQSTDIVTVRAAEIRSTTIKIVIGLRSGPDPGAVTKAARAAVQALADECHRLDETLYVQAIGAAATVAPARWARVVVPAEDVVGGAYGAPWVSSIEIDVEIER